MSVTTLTATATGSHTRVQMKAKGMALVPHGTVNAFDPKTGVFSAFMDYQPAGEPALQFTPMKDAGPSDFTDQNGQVWQLVG